MVLKFAVGITFVDLEESLVYFSSCNNSNRKCMLLQFPKVATLLAVLQQIQLSPGYSQFVLTLIKVVL